MSTIPMEYRPKDTGRTTNILLANNHLAIAQVAELRVAVAVGMFGAVFLPQQLQGHVRTTEFLVDPHVTLQ